MACAWQILSIGLSAAGFDHGIPATLLQSRKTHTNESIILLSVLTSSENKSLKWFILLVSSDGAEENRGALRTGHTRAEPGRVARSHLVSYRLAQVTHDLLVPLQHHPVDATHTHICVVCLSFRPSIRPWDICLAQD